MRRRGSKLFLPLLPICRQLLSRGEKTYLANFQVSEKSGSLPGRRARQLPLNPTPSMMNQHARIPKASHSGETWVRRLCSACWSCVQTIVERRVHHRRIGWILGRRAVRACLGSLAGGVPALIARLAAKASLTTSQNVMGGSASQNGVRTDMVACRTTRAGPLRALRGF